MATPEELQNLLAEVRKSWKAKVTSRLSTTQQQDRTDKPAKGPIWVSRCRVVASPELDSQQLVIDSFHQLSSSDQHIQIDLQSEPEIDSEWLAMRRDHSTPASEPLISEREKFELMNHELDEDSPVVLFLHGGNMTFGGPVPYRGMLRRLAKAVGARCFTPAYRLAPKHPFPAALIDVVQAYLYLLAPPPGAFHRPIPASKIIFAGESAGCALAFAMIRILLHAISTRASAMVHYHGQLVALQLPAGVTAFSPYLDFTVSLPSERFNMDNDVLVRSLVNPPNNPSEYDHEVRWPSDPPRHDFYCQLNALDHELVSPAAVVDWAGAPPMWICAGGHERPLDCAKVLAQRAYESGVKVQFHQYEHMPHTWFAFLPKLQSSKKCFEHWAQGVKSIMDGSFASHAVTTDAWTSEETTGQLSRLVSFPLDHVSKYMRAEKLSRKPVVLPSSKSHL